MAHGNFVWNELMTTDPDKAKSFFAKVLGWQSENMDMGPNGTYTIWKSQGQMAGGMMKYDPKEMGGVPPHWMAYIEVDDVDARAKQATNEGGRVVVEPFDVPNVGRIALIADPTGAVVGIMKGAQ